MLTKEQSNDLERLQMQALKCIFGLQWSYGKLLEKTNIETLKNRRESACARFAEKCIAGKFAHWFPKKESKRELRQQKIYVEEYARCERLKNSPIFYMRRLMNKLAANPEK
jgi:hypothetical protein